MEWQERFGLERQRVEACREERKDKEDLEIKRAEVATSFQERLFRLH